MNKKTKQTLRKIIEILFMILGSFLVLIGYEKVGSIIIVVSTTSFLFGALLWWGGY